MTAETFQDLFEQARQRDSYWDEWLLGDFRDSLARRMAESSISKSELARRIGASPAYVTKVLRGDTNLTLRSMAKLARALGCVVRVHVAPLGTSTRFVDIIEGGDAGSVSNEATEIAFGQPASRQYVSSITTSHGSPHDVWSVVTSPERVA